MAQTSSAEFAAHRPRRLSPPAPSPPGEPGLPPPENRVFYPALDGLRALAVLLVFFHHYRLRPDSPLAWGWVGVDIFFVLSGFLITGILYDTRHAPNRVSSFYARRTLRIFPLFYAVWLVTLALSHPLHLRWTERWWLWPVYLGNYTHLTLPLTSSASQIDWLSVGATHWQRFGSFLSFGHLWSLCMEEQFYLVWPLVVFLVLDRRRLFQICCWSIAVLPFLRLAIIYLLASPLTRSELLLRLYRETPLRFDAFLVGAAVALSLRGSHPQALFRLSLPVFLSTAALFALTLLCATAFFHTAPNTTPNTPWISSFGFTMLDVMAACLILFALQPSSLFHHVLCWPPLRQLGRMSYGFYVFHDIYHDGMSRLGFRLSLLLTHRYHPRTGELLAFLVTLVLSSISYHFFEVPLLRLKRHFTAA